MKLHRILLVTCVLVGLIAPCVFGCATGERYQVQAVDASAVTDSPVEIDSSLDLEEYNTFSLRVAEEQIKTVGMKNWRIALPLTFNLAGINEISGLIYDRVADDVILVGRAIPGRPALTLDDFAVVLRAALKHNWFPEVSIDPVDDTPRTNMQHVRFEGGIENSAVGMDLFDADLRLKKLGQGILDSGIEGFQSHWAMALEDALNEGRIAFADFIETGTADQSESTISARFWFRPTEAFPTIRDNVISLERIEIGVFTEVEGVTNAGRVVQDLTGYVDPIGNEFAIQVSEHYDEISEHHPSIARVRGILELTGLAEAIGDMFNRPDFSYWLDEYRIDVVPTPVEQEVLSREHNEPFHYEDETWIWDYEVIYEMSGGVTLGTTPIILTRGDVEPLREAVISSRPGLDTLSWPFNIASWEIPVIQGAIKGSGAHDVMCENAAFLLDNFRYTESISVYNRILDFFPDSGKSYLNRGICHFNLRDYERAVEDSTSAIDVIPDWADAYNIRGLSYEQMGLQDKATEDFDTVLRLDPQFENAGDVAESKKKDLKKQVAQFAEEFASEFNVPVCLYYESAKQPSREVLISMLRRYRLVA